MSPVPKLVLTPKALNGADSAVASSLNLPSHHPDFLIDHTCNLSS